MRMFISDTASFFIYTYRRDLPLPALRKEIHLVITYRILTFWNTNFIFTVFIDMINSNRFKPFTNTTMWVFMLFTRYTLNPIKEIFIKFTSFCFNTSISFKYYFTISIFKEHTIIRYISISWVIFKYFFPIH